jgi:gliding motility-associated lipoprotein GldH
MFNIHFSRILVSFLMVYLFSSCSTIDLYEKTVSLPGHQWKSGDVYEFDFIIKDSAALYQPGFVMRHTEKYNYNNIWVNFYYQLPGDTLRKELKELQLASPERGWLASGMNDIYEHRLPLTSKPLRLKPGKYTFKLENIMREDPLLHVLNVGIRIEKLK